MELAKWAKLSSAALSLFYAGLLLANTSGYFWNQPISNAGLIFALALAGIFYLSVGRIGLRLDWSLLVLGLLCVILFILLASLISGVIYDFSADGRDYHQTAVMRLTEGWNPAKEAQGQDDTYLSMWLNHYPRGAWIAAASIYKLTGNIETGKIFTLLLMSAVFLIAWSILLDLPRLKIWETTLLAFLAAANPVSITQSLSFTIDGQVAAAYALVFSWLIAAIFRIDLPDLVGIASTVLVALNIKFTGTVYTALLLGFLILGGLWLRKSWSWTIRVSLAAFCGLALGLLVVGFNPYVTNFVSYGHPFYPLYGGQQFNKEFVMRGQMPVNFEGKAWGEKLLISLLSPSQNTYQADSGPLKLPFTLTIEELKQFRMSDVRLAGMGPLFSGAILLSIGALAVLLLAERKVGLAVAGLMSIIILTMLVNPEAWWARYAPQIWLIPLLAATGCLASKVNRLVQWSGWIVMLVLLINIALIWGAYLAGNARDTWRMQEKMHLLAENKAEVLVYYGSLESTVLKLDSAGVNYQAVENFDELPCPELLAPMVFISPTDCAVPVF